jgi:hypothetical protein
MPVAQRMIALSFIVLVGGYFISEAIAGVLFELASRSTMPGTRRWQVESCPAKYNVYKGEPSPEHFTRSGIRAIESARKVRRVYRVLALISFLVLVTLKLWR